MNKSRRHISVSLLALMASGVVGCSSTNKKSPNKESSDIQYEELVSSVLVSKDGNILIVMTDRYHYIFDVPELIKQSLTGNFHRKLVAEFDEFTINSSNEVLGMVNLRLQNATHEENLAAQNAGFRQTSTGSEVNVTLSGIRYYANNVLPSNEYKLNREYKINVRYKATQPVSTYKKKPGRTPVYASPAGILMILTLPLVIPLLMFACTSNKGCQ